MIITTIEIRKLTPADGMTLTNGETFSDGVFLGKEDSPDNWHEITDAEAEELQKAAESEEV